MRTKRNGPQRRRGGRLWTATFCVLLMAVASAGCNKEQAAQEGIPEEAETPGALSDAVETPVPTRPKIRFAQPNYDFGEVEAGDEVEHTFLFENTGDDLLSIGEVLTSCGCTAALVTEKEVPPGGTGEIKATFQTQGFQGAVKKGLAVKSNDPENKIVRLTIGGKVVSEVSVEPGYLDWEILRPGDSPRPKKLSIRFLKGRGLRLEKIQSESPSVVLTKKSEDENRAVYSVALAENLPTGRFTGRITIRSNSERVPEVHVPFQGRVQGNVRVIPHILSLGRVTPGKALTRHLSVSKTGEQGFTVQGVKATTQAIATEIHEEKEGERYGIQVTYTPGKEIQGRIAERITILLNDGKEAFLEVPLYGTADEGTSKTRGRSMGEASAASGGGSIPLPGTKTEVGRPQTARAANRGPGHVHCRRRVAGVRILQTPLATRSDRLHRDTPRSH